MFARVLLCTKRVSVRACFLRLSTERRKQQERAKCRERDTMGEILMISRWIIFLWCFCFGVKNLSQIFEKRNAPLTAPPQKTTIITRQKSATGGQTPRTSREQEQKNKKRKKRRKITHELCFYYSTHHLSHPTNRHTSSSQQRDSLTLFCETKKERETARNLKEVHHVYIFSFAKERLRFVIKNTSKS